MRLAAASAVLFLCMSIGAVTAAEERWLTEYRANATALFPRGGSGDIKEATDALQGKLKALFGKVVDVTLSPPVQRDGTIVFGTPSHSNLINIQLSDTLKELGAHGYLIRSMVGDNHRVTVIAGNTDADVLNGVYAFLQLLDKRQPITGLNVLSPLKPTVQSGGAAPFATAPVAVTPTIIAPAGGGKEPPPTATPTAVPISVSIFGIELNLKLVSVGLALSLLISLSALILPLIIPRRKKMLKSASQAGDGQFESMSLRLSRLEQLVSEIRASLPEMADAPRSPSLDPQHWAAKAYDRSAQFREDGPNQFGFERNPPPAALLAETVRAPVVSDAAAAQEARMLVSEYHKLIANRLSGLENFVDKYGAQPIQPTSEAGLYRAGSQGEDCYLWAVAIASRDDYIVILPGKEMIRKWSLFSKAAGSGARPYLNGAYALNTGGRGELSILEPAIASFDPRRKLFELQNPGTLSGAT